MTSSQTQRDRFAATELLDAPVAESRFVDASRTRALAKLDIGSVRDLVTNYPSRYLDMTEIASLRDARIGVECTVVGRIHEIREKRPKPRLTITEISLFDGTGVLVGVWFRQPWIALKYAVGDKVAFSGKVVFEYGFKKMNAPFVEVLASDGDEGAGRILPIHRTTEGLSTNWMRRLIAAALDDARGVLDHLPPTVRAARNLMRLDSALRSVHFPKTMVECEQARHRLAYDELFLLQLYLTMRRDSYARGASACEHVVDGPHLAALKKAIPFKLTDDQMGAAEEILSDMSASASMNRMLLGDVGTGKTLVAAHALAAVADTGGQVAMMAPTEVLAQQYGEKVGPLLDEAGITWALLTGSTTAAARRDILASVAAGETTVLFGTHALIEGDVEFARLTLAIVDEQHRFGVNQRLALRAKGVGADMLVMTATPIPRTLALTLYGDLDCSYLRERPSGRAPVETTLETKNRTGEAYDRIRAAVKQGRQAYIICPLVGVKRPADEDERAAVTEELAEGHDLSDLKAAVDHSEFLQNKVFTDMRVGLLTGRMRPAEKTEVMRRFRNREIDILVSTTVVEVGVDVPNATIMLVEDAERFGLSQLHQLRGRVGRGEHPGEVILFADARSDESRARMKALVETSDGFELAEYDLRLRREGDVLGDRQHGLPTLKLTGVLTDTALIELARSDARGLLAVDPQLEKPENGPLARELRRAYAQAWEWVSAG